ncbi:uncharacterized protein EAE98_007340 [Botrytis deweyae]|uniref:Uncharacterized protein n=1 Tax=Botrytis deweyae TaxID=2478750 RepID=A0ABQ7IHC3_9HELO|nr:uncharacterized protein EAE98_007340 [Botrytis deweyae]KAF7924289.1 hypothetical protein EAE98_007340 [Botrytis deweyae]
MDPEFYIPEKAEKCWAGDPYMLEKAKSYGIQARKLGDRLRWSTVGNHAWMDNEIPRCVPRVCLFELEGSSLQSKNQPQHFQSARDLRFYFMNSRVDQSSSETQKRLIILEDIDPRFAELLGVMLEIPPAFFISHYHRDINLRLLDRTYAQTKNSKCWKTAIPRCSTLDLLKDDHEDYEGDYNLFAGNFFRRPILNEEMGGILHFHSVMSYWGQQLGDSSWTTVLLVDSPKTYLLPAKAHLQDPAQNAIHLVNTRPKNPWYQQVLLDPPNSYTIASNRGCMYDFLTAAHKGSGYEYSENPFSATVYARNFVRAAWEVNVARLSHSSYFFVYASRENDGSIEDIQLHDRRVVEGYQDLIFERTKIRYARKCVVQIVSAFQCGRVSPSHFSSGRCQTEKASNTEELEEESNIWRLLDKDLEIVEIQINQHMEEYAQRAALNEAHANRLQTFEANKQTMAANRQARSAGQLTKIATAVVPSTVVASIFSMGGDFAAGEKLFLVYWAISLPVTLALLIWVLHEDISKAWSKLTVRRRSKEYGSDDSESETSDSESDYTSSESGTSERGSEYVNSESEISNRESDDKGSKRNWLRFLRRQRKGATVDEEKATESRSIRGRSFQTARSDSIIPADNMSFEIRRQNTIRSEDGSFKTAKTNSLAVREGSSIVSKDHKTKKRNTL